jgi:REP element-mobilizing transposase RayT
MGRRVSRGQQSFEFRTWGGKRKGAGRKRRAPRPQVPHRSRPALDGRTPVHVTLRLLPEIARLRRRAQFHAIRIALTRTSFRADHSVCHFTVQSNHLHLVCEPKTKQGLSRGMMAFKSSCAKRLNALVARRGRVFADRYHARYLVTPAQVRAALCYCLNNWRHHGADRGHDWRVDPFSSGDLFDGWTNHAPRRPAWLPDGERRPVSKPTFWLLAIGWRRHGAIHPTEVPGAKMMQSRACRRVSRSEPCLRSRRRLD